MPARTYENARERILDAAERLILGGGLSRLGVEAVSTEAGLSKGGFFHHFASKDALLLALLQRFVSRMEQQITALAAEDPEPRGARLRAQIALSFDAIRRETDAPRALILALIESARTRPDMLAHAREVNAAQYARDEAEGIPLGRSVLIQLALDGFWLNEALESAILTAAQKRVLRDELLALARPQASAAPPPKTPSKAPKTRKTPEKKGRAT